MGNGEWLLMIAHPGSVSYPSPLYPSYPLYADEREPENISDDIAEAIKPPRSVTKR
jgi:hypothetical protein